MQLVEEAGRKILRVRRYQPAAGDEAGTGGTAADNGPSARRLAATPLALHEIGELTGRLPVEVLQAILVETRPSFALSSKRLIELRRAQVPPAVIDLIVALSFPKQFAVDRARSTRPTCRSTC